MNKFDSQRGSAAEKRGPERLGEAEEALYEILVPESLARAINPRDFIDLYGENTVNTDEKRVKELESVFSVEEVSDPTTSAKKKRGKLFEALVGNQIDNSNWFGEGASLIVPSTYDDFTNGVDGVVEFEEELGRSHLALAIDVTKSERAIQDKFEKIKDSIRRGNLSRVKYFESQDFRGELKLVPRVVVGSDEKTISSAIDIILKFQRLQKEIKKRRSLNESEEKLQIDIGRFRELRSKLEAHPLQFRLLIEIKEQLTAFIDYAQKLNQKGPVEAYGKVLRIIERILAEKLEISSIQETMDEARDDKVFQMIISNAKNFDKK